MRHSVTHIGTLLGAPPKKRAIQGAATHHEPLTDKRFSQDADLVNDRRIHVSCAHAIHGGDFSVDVIHRETELGRKQHVDVSHEQEGENS